MNKYKNKKVEFDGIIFDSLKELARYKELLLLKKQGLITDLKLQHPFVLVPTVRIKGKKKPDVKYVADFVYVEDGRLVVEDVKSVITRKLPTYRLKIHLLKYNLNIEVVEI